MTNTENPADSVTRDIREASGNIKDNRGLVAFLYELMRDHLPAGRVEEMTRNSPTRVEPWVMTNGWLGLYAQNIADRLEGDLPMMTLPELSKLQEKATKGLQLRLVHHLTAQRPRDKAEDIKAMAKQLWEVILSRGYVGAWETVSKAGNVAERWALRDHLREELALIRSGE